jgi:glycosyltransferase involved in cell wall biosynthesis
MNESCRISVAVPVHNEEANIGILLARVRQVLADLPSGPHEVIVVDDGSTDSTLGILRREASEDAGLLIVALSRNFGHQAALTAALDHTTGDVVIVMDGDLQDTPEAIPDFLSQYHQGFDVVYAKRVQRQEGWLLRASYFLFYRIIAALSRINLPLDAGDFGLMSRRVVEELRRTPERQRYLRGLRSWVGFRQIGIPVARGSRGGGQSKYTSLKLFGLALDGIFAFSVVPLRIATALGAAAVAGASAFAAYSLYARLVLNESPRGFTALIIAITFLSGVHLFFLGVIGEYVGRVYEEVKARPPYVIRELIGER